MVQRLHAVACLSLIALLIPLSAVAQVARPVRLHIGAATRGGFVETSKEIQDSIKDITKQIKGLKGVARVQSRSDADLRLVITGRGTGSEYFGQRLSFSESYLGADITSTPISQNTWWVATVLEVVDADYRKEFVGSYTHPAGLDYYGGAWTACASRLAQDMKVWLEANSEQVLLAKKKLGGDAVLITGASVSTVASAGYGGGVMTAVVLPVKEQTARVIVFTPSDSSPARASPAPVAAAPMLSTAAPVSAGQGDAMPAAKSPEPASAPGETCAVWRSAFLAERRNARQQSVVDTTYRYALVLLETCAFRSS